MSQTRTHKKPTNQNKQGKQAGSGRQVKHRPYSQNRQAGPGSNKQVRWASQNSHPQRDTKVKLAVLVEQVRWTRSSGKVKQASLSWATNGEPNGKRKKAWSDQLENGNDDPWVIENRTTKQKSKRP